MNTKKRDQLSGLSLQKYLIMLTYFAVLYLTAMVIIAHFFMPPEYNWLQNTISELAAQKLEYQWIMQSGFIGFGLLINTALLGKMIAATRLYIPDLPIMLWGIAILLTGIFSTAPFIEGMSVSVKEAYLHSLFAQLGGIALSIGVVLSVFSADSGKKRVLHLIFLILIMGISLLFSIANDEVISIGPGIIQRILWVVGLTWVLINQNLCEFGETNE